ncbi:hypothetical protein JCM16303_006507 [Sporobolomyces ruberrimus]
MAFSFGAPAAPKPAGSTFSFGAPAASTSTSTPSLFGSTPAPTSSAPSLFGSTPAQPASGGLFGNTSTAAPSGGLFGSTSAPPAQGASLFGGGAPKPATTSLFGTSQPASTPSLFGAPQPQTSQPATSLFGQQPQSQPQLGGSLFGQQPQQQQQQQQPAVTSAPLFGQSQSAATASLFGSKPASTQPQTTSVSLFGNNFNQSSTSQPPNQFGASTQNPSQQQQQQNLSQSSIRKLGESSLPPNPNEPSIESRLESIKSSYDPQNPKCRFQTYFYNEPGVGQSVKSYARPPNGTDEKAWSKAVKENPDPDHLVPAIAIGFTALQKRIDSQQRQNTAHQSLLTEIHSHVSTLESTHSLTTSLRTLRAQQTSLSLLSRLTSLISKVSSLSPNRNSSLKKEEESLRILLEGMKGEVERLGKKSNELWTGVGMMKARKKEMEQLEWAVADEQGFNQIIEVLTSQQKGLNHLTKTLSNMTTDVDVMNEAFGLPRRHKSVASLVESGGGDLNSSRATGRR